MATTILPSSLTHAAPEPLLVALVEAAAPALSADRMAAVATEFENLARGQVRDLLTSLRHAAGAMPDAPGGGLFNRHELEQWTAAQARQAEMIAASLEAADTARACSVDKA